MAEYSKSLLAAGFLNKTGAQKKAELGEGWNKFVEGLQDSQAEIYVDEEIAEIVNIQPANDANFASYQRTGYPPPGKKYWLIFESMNASIEESYYWILSQLRIDQSYPEFHKTIDSFSASEQSSMWGGSQARIKLQQDTISQYLANIGKMIKDLFQIVRELRIIDERLELYDNWETSKSADVTLKGLYVDLVEGASKNPSSVYGLAQQVGFTILPDLFFNTQVFDLDRLDKTIDNMEYNQAIKNVLRRKLFSYITWKHKTDKELRARRSFQIKYLKQHWAVIKMYMEWIKPYLRNVRRLQMRDQDIESVDIVSAFETSITEIEFLAVKPASGKVHPVILCNFMYKTRPELAFQKDQYTHKGPVHAGRMDMEIRAYAWTKEEIENFKSFRRKEGFELLSILDESIKAAMDAMGDDLEKYIAEAEGTYKKEDSNTILAKGKKIKKPRGESIFSPFLAIFQGLAEMGSAVIPLGSIIPSKKDKSLSGPSSSAKKEAMDVALVNAWLTYKNYKKAHRLITW